MQKIDEFHKILSNDFDFNHKDIDILLDNNYAVISTETDHTVIYQVKKPFHLDNKPMDTGSFFIYRKA